MNKQKARGLLRLKLNGIFSPFKFYGLDVLIPGAVEETMQAVEEYEREILNTKICEDFMIKKEVMPMPPWRDKFKEG